MRGERVRGRQIGLGGFINCTPQSSLGSLPSSEAEACESCGNFECEEGQTNVMMGFIRIEKRTPWIQDRQISWNPNSVGEIDIFPGQKPL